MRLPNTAMYCWEPDEGIGAMLPMFQVGQLQWKRTHPDIEPADIYDAPPDEQDEKSYPQDFYRWVLDPGKGKEIVGGHLLAHKDGGFIEPRPYTVALVFLLLRRIKGDVTEDSIRRAAAVLNNFLDCYRFVTQDPMVRQISSDRDSYYSVVSLAEVPPDQQQRLPRDLLGSVEQLQFSHIKGEGRGHHFGLNDWRDIFPGQPLSAPHLPILEALTVERQELEIHHQLFLSAIRRIKHFETALAVVDAQSAFEAFIALILKERLAADNKSPKRIERMFRNELDSLHKRLAAVDDYASKLSGSSSKFVGSQEHLTWKAHLYSLRNAIVHEGRRTVSFAEAKAGLCAGLKAVEAISQLAQPYQRRFSWGGQVCDLPGIEPTAGRLMRMFEL